VEETHGGDEVDGRERWAREEEVQRVLRERERRQVVREQCEERRQREVRDRRRPAQGGASAYGVKGGRGQPHCSRMSA
jgi:hypothetical protein